MRSLALSTRGHNTARAAGRQRTGFRADVKACGLEFGAPAVHMNRKRAGISACCSIRPTSDASSGDLN